MAVSKTVSGEKFESGFADRPEYRIEILKADHRVSVVVNEAEIVSNTSPMILKEAELKPVYYFPRGVVEMSALIAVTKTSWCPYKGRASYFALADNPELGEIAWTYADPFREVAAIARCVAFYPQSVSILDR